MWAWIAALAAGCAGSAPLVEAPVSVEDTPEGAGDTVPDEATPPDDSDLPAPELVVLSLNLHCYKTEATSFPDNAARFAAIADVVAAERVYAIAVQEACQRDGVPTAMEQLADALRAATGETWGAAWTPVHMAWEGTPDEALEGVGLLVRGEDPQEVVVVDHAVQGALWRRSIGCRLPNTSVRLFSTHLEYNDASARRAQARELAMHALVPDDPRTLLAGDYNAAAGDAPIADMLAAGMVRLSAPADAGGEIDHVFAPAAAGFEVLDARMLFDGGLTPVVSDHPGVLLRVREGRRSAPTVTRMVALTEAPSLFVRGDTAPLSWDLGWAAVMTAPGRWEAAWHGWEAADGARVAFKFLREDVGWETGQDHEVAVGQSVEVRPVF